MCALKLSQSPPRGAVFGANGLDRISELHERSLGRAHQTGFVVDGLATQKSGDLVGRMRGGPRPAALRALRRAK